MLLSNKVPLDKRPTRAQMHWGCSSSALVHTHVGKGGTSERSLGGQVLQEVC